MKAAILFTTIALWVPPVIADAQWQIQDAPTTSDLRGIDSLGNGVAWASGANGTVLRTLDAGASWQPCAVPPGADHLDFRAIQGFDTDTAIVMSAGKGDLSRLYKTWDGCHTWKLLSTNTDKDGFWDTIKFQDRNFGVLLGDPVGGKFYARYTNNGGANWLPFASDETLRVTGKSAGLFAASNSALLMPENHQFIFAVANLDTSAIILQASLAEVPCHKLNIADLGAGLKKFGDRCPKQFVWEKPGTVPIPRSGDSAGAYSLTIDPVDVGGRSPIVAVGGDYTKPDAPGAAAYSRDLTENWLPAETPPHGYRSAVAYDALTSSLIAVGPNGTDTSLDDGHTWQPLKPADPASDEDQHWNALSLPFVVGPKGRIGLLRPSALKAATPAPDLSVTALDRLRSAPPSSSTPSLNVTAAAPLESSASSTVSSGTSTPTLNVAPAAPIPSSVTPAAANAPLNVTPATPIPSSVAPAAANAPLNVTPAAPLPSSVSPAADNAPLNVTPATPIPSSASSTETSGTSTPTLNVTPATPIPSSASPSQVTPSSAPATPSPAPGAPTPPGPPAPSTTPSPSRL